MTADTPTPVPTLSPKTDPEIDAYLGERFAHPVLHPAHSHVLLLAG